MYRIPDTAAFVEGRERGVAWAKAQLEAPDADPRELLSAEHIEAALGSDRGDAGHGFLRGVRDVIMGLHPYERPNVIIEVAKDGGSASTTTRRAGLWQRLRGTAFDE